MIECLTNSEVAQKVQVMMDYPYYQTGGRLYNPHIRPIA